MANTVFSLCAAAGSLAVSVLAAIGESWAVAVVFGALTVGFLARASERRWRGRR